MVTELDDPRSRLDIPEHAGHISRTGYDLAVIDETAAAEITGVSTKLTGTLQVGATVLVVEVVNGADVIQTTAGHKVARGRIRTGHDPAGTKRNSMDFVGGVGIPDDELSVLRSRN